MCSIQVASANLGFGATPANELCNLFATTYFEQLKNGYIRVLEKETAKGAIKEFLKKIQNRKRKQVINKKPRHSEPLSASFKKELTKHLHQWAKRTTDPEFFKIKDMAFRIAGTSSLGLKRYVVLM